MAQNINLHATGRRRPAPISRAGVAALTVLALAAAGVLYGLEARRQVHLRAAAEEAERAASRLEKQLAATPSAAKHAQQDLNALEGEVVALEAVALRLSSGALGRTTGFTAPLRALARGSTDGVWLTGIRFDNAGNQIALEGKALDAARVPAFIERLRRAPQFSGSTFATIELKPSEETGVRAPAALVRFRLATPAVEADKTAGAKS
ncbi:MAG TPA: PilN domain-containing protein [Burkholderiaceae bacterium]|nr:PilN domain-containing protein [Burkholderiaceae bacterium]